MLIAGVIVAAVALVSLLFWISAAKRARSMKKNGTENLNGFAPSTFKKSARIFSIATVFLAAAAATLLYFALV